MKIFPSKYLLLETKVHLFKYLKRVTMLFYQVQADRWLTLMHGMMHGVLNLSCRQHSIEPTACSGLYFLVNVVASYNGLYFVQLHHASLAEFHTRNLVRNNNNNDSSAC